VLGIGVTALIASIPTFNCHVNKNPASLKMEQKPKKLLDQVRDAIRLKNYAYSTEKTYVDSGTHWV
jgi:hypothetical protein